VEPNRKSYSLFRTDPTPYNGAHNAGLEASEDPNLPNSSQRTQQKNFAKVQLFDNEDLPTTKRLTMVSKEEELSGVR